MDKMSYKLGLTNDDEFKYKLGKTTQERIMFRDHCRIKNPDYLLIICEPHKSFTKDPSIDPYIKQSK